MGAKPLNTPKEVTRLQTIWDKCPKNPNLFTRLATSKPNLPMRPKTLKNYIA